MIKFHLWAVALALTLLTVNANAGVIEATSTFPGLLSDFRIEFTDTNDNKLLDFDELNFFSGLTASGLGPDIDGFYSILSGVPEITAVAVNGSCTNAADLWCFTNDNGILITSNRVFWTYELTLSTDPQPPTGVPAPATIAQLAAGLLLLRRRTKTLVNN